MLISPVISCNFIPSSSPKELVIFSHQHLLRCRCRNASDPDHPSHRAPAKNLTQLSWIVIRLFQGLVTVPFWEYWTSPYSSHYRPLYLMVGWCDPWGHQSWPMFSEWNSWLLAKSVKNPHGPKFCWQKSLFLIPTKKWSFWSTQNPTRPT